MNKPPASALGGSGTAAIVAAGAAASKGAKHPLTPAAASADKKLDGEHDASSSKEARLIGTGGGGGSGGDGGGTPPESEDGFTLLKDGISHARNALLLIEQGSGAIQTRMAELEAEITALRAERSDAPSESHSEALLQVQRLISGIRDVEAKNRDLRRRNRELKGAAEEGDEAKRELATIKGREQELAEALDRVLEEAAGLRSANAAAYNAIASLISMIEPAEASVSGTLDKVAELDAKLTDGDGGEKKKEIVGLLEGVASLLESIRGEGTTALEAIDQVKSQRPSAIPTELISEILSGRGAVDLSFTADWLPMIDEGALGHLPEATELVLKQVFSRLAWVFSDQSDAEIGRLSGAVIDALHIASRSKAPAMRKAVSKTLATILNPSIRREYMIRGFVYELIRMALLMRSGREFNEYSKEIVGIEFDGWRYDEKMQRLVRKKMLSRGEIDAIEGETFLEIKSIWLGGSLGKYVCQMLKASDSIRSIGVDFYGPPRKEDEFDPVAEAEKFVNQLAKYKRLIDSGTGKILELHITSREPVPDEVVSAIHAFFGEGQVEVIWYDHILTHEGKSLSPQLSLSITPPPTPEEEAEAEPTADEHLDTAPIEGLPEPFEEEDEVIPEVTVIEEAGEIVELAPATEPVVEVEEIVEAEEVEVAEEGLSEEQLEAQIEFEDTVTEATNVVAPNTAFLESIDYNMSGVDDFTRWLVREGHWEGEVKGLEGDELSEKLIELYATWVEVTSVARVQTNPWDSIKDSRALNFVNGKIRRIAKKKTKLDFSHRYTRGLLYSDINIVLSEFQNELEVGSPIRNEIGDFIAFIRDNYQANTYFKTQEDGPRLIDIIKHFLWLRDGGDDGNVS